MTYKSLLKKLIPIFNVNKNRKCYAFILYTSFIISIQKNIKTDKNKIVSSILDKFNLSNNDKILLNRNITWIIQNESISKTLITKLWLDHGDIFVSDLKDILSVIDHKKVKILLTVFNNSPPVFQLSGKDLKKLGLSESKEMGKIINMVRDWWISNDCLPTKAMCLNFIKNYLGQI